MAKKLTLEDLKVQSFVTTLNTHQADQLVGATAADTDCSSCTRTHCGECTNMADSNCCEGGTAGGCDTSACYTTIYCPTDGCTATPTDATCC
jgi:hypothetical protein